MGALCRGELAGERLQVAATEQDQEHEQSCFSDNTHIDVRENLQAIRNVWDGKYTRINGMVVQGYALKDLIALRNAPLATATTQALDAAKTAAERIPTPFDQAILNQTGLQAIATTIEALTQVSNKLVDAAAAFGLTFSTDV